MAEGVVGKLERTGLNDLASFLANKQFWAFWVSLVKIDWLVGWLTARRRILMDRVHGSPRRQEVTQSEKVKHCHHNDNTATAVKGVCATVTTV